MSANPQLQVWIPLPTRRAEPGVASPASQFALTSSTTPADPNVGEMATLLAGSLVQGGGSEGPSGNGQVP